MHICGPKSFPLSRAESWWRARRRETGQEALAMDLGLEVFPVVGGKEGVDQRRIVDDSKRAIPGGHVVCE